MPNETLQFPLALLVDAKERSTRITNAIFYAFIKTGMDRQGKLSRTQAAQEIIGYTPPHPGKGITEAEIAAIILGCKFCALSPPTTTHQAKCWLETYRGVQSWLDQWQAAGRKTAWTRVPATMVLEARDGSDWSYRRFTALCAVNAVIGSKSIATITRNRVRAGMLGYTGAGMLFEKGGQLTESGRALLAERMDGAEPETTSQARTWLDSLVKCGFLHRFAPPKRGSLTYYSKTLSAEQIALELIRRAQRTSSDPRLKELGELLERTKQGLAPLCGESLLCGEPLEKSPHNGESPHNEETATQSPPDRHLVATPSPHNAASYASQNASLNALSYAVGESPPASFGKSHQENAETDFWSPVKVEERRLAFQKLRDEINRVPQP